MSNKPGNHLLPLTGLRFFAAAMVVIYHFSNVANPVLRNFIEHGTFGVTVFFVLSGFILAYSYASKPGEMRGSAKNFWAARVARLYPTYLLGMALMAPVVLSSRGDSVSLRFSSGVLSLILGQAWFHSFGLHWGMWNPPGWSLSAEAFFYLLFPVVCVMLSRLSKGWLMLVGAAFCSLAVSGVFMQSVFPLDAGDFWGFVPLTRLPEFLVGVTAGLIWKGRTTSSFDRVAPFLTIASALALVAIMCLRIDTRWYCSGALAPLVALFICALACGQGAVARLLSWRPLVFLGGASYSLYILHWPMWRLAYEVSGKSVLAIQQPHIFFAAYFIFTTCLSCVCFRYFEEPLNQLLRQELMTTPMPASQANDVVAQHDELITATPQN
jgi:peptidoglycan/LPS O-acetylase OafA/YrhL